MQTAPILSGPPGFILLMFVAAMAAYLRQVNATARDKIESIRSEKKILWPFAKMLPHSEERLKLLEATRNKIKWVTHVFFALAVVVGLRLFWATLAPLWEVSDSLFWMRLADLLLVTIVTVTLLAMWCMHSVSRKKDDRIHELMIKYSDSRKIHTETLPN